MFIFPTLFHALPGLYCSLSLAHRSTFGFVFTEKNSRYHRSLMLIKLLIWLVLKEKRRWQCLISLLWDYAWKRFEYPHLPSAWLPVFITRLQPEHVLIVRSFSIFWHVWHFCAKLPSVSHKHSLYTNKTSSHAPWNHNISRVVNKCKRRTLMTVQFSPKCNLFLCHIICETFWRTSIVCASWVFAACFICAIQL